MSNINTEGLIDDVYTQFERLSHETFTDQEAARILTTAVTQLHMGCDLIKSSLSTSEWQEWMTKARKHPLADLIWCDNLCSRSFLQPRGYPGDAVTLDYMYFGPSEEEKSSMTLWQRRLTGIHFETNVPRVVRERGMYIGKWVDNEVTLRNQSKPLRVLSVASGHTREMIFSLAFFKKRIEVVGLDQDKQSLEHSEREYKEQQNLMFTTCHASIKLLLKQDEALLTSLGRFDLIYSSGLFDYLDKNIAIRLVSVLFDRLLMPNGRLLIANIMPTIASIAFAEVFMNWKLVHRNIEDMQELTQSLPSAWVVEKSMGVFSPNVAYLDIRRSTNDLSRTNDTVVDMIKPRMIMRAKF